MYCTVPTMPSAAVDVTAVPGIVGTAAVIASARGAIVGAPIVVAPIVVAPMVGAPIVAEPFVFTPMVAAIVAAAAPRMCSGSDAATADDSTGAALERAIPKSM